MSITQRSVDSGWPVHALREVAGQPQYGWTTRARAGAGTKLLRTTDITSGRIDWDAVPACEEDPTDVAKYRLSPGDIVISRAGSVGFSALIDKSCPGNAVFASYLVRVRPNPTFIRPRFLAHYMRSPHYWGQISDAVVGIGLANVNGSKLAAIKLPVPSLAEQERLVGVLDRCESSLAVATEHLDRARRAVEQFRQTVLMAACSGSLTADLRERPARKAVGDSSPSLAAEYHAGVDLPHGWIVEPVSNLFRIQNGRAFPSGEYENEGIRLLRPGNLGPDGAVHWDSGRTAHLPIRWAEEFPDFVLGQGELVMNLTAQSLKDEFLGRACLKTDSEPALLNQRIARFINMGDEDLRPYALLYFKSVFFRRFVNDLDSGTLIRHMHSKQVLNHLMLIPPSAERGEVVRRAHELLSSADALLRRIGRASQQLGDTSRAALAKVFAGELSLNAEGDLAEQSYSRRK